MYVRVYFIAALSQKPARRSGLATRPVYAGLLFYAACVAENSNENIEEIICDAVDAARSKIVG